VTGNPGGGFNGLVIVALRLGAFGVMLLLGYQSFDSLRSAWKGVNARSSKEVDNPAAWSNRWAGFGWGMICAALFLVVLCALIFRIGPWASYHGG
jgi:hypothetical protein